jgi:hypothetical protein
MVSKVVHGYAWYTYPDVFGREDEEAADPGHPFASRPGEVATPPEVVYFRATSPADAGLRNEHHAHAFLVMTKTQLHPKVNNGWESEPAYLTDKFKTEDGKVRMVKIVEMHRGRHGEVMECELKVDEG